MLRGFHHSVRQRLERYFPERQLFCRSGGEVVFVRLRTPVQLAAVMVLLAAGGWAIYAAANLVMFDRIIADKDRQIAELAAAYRGLGQEFETTRQRFQAITQELEEKHRQLQELVEHRGALEKRLAEITRELDGVVAQRDRFITMKRELNQRLSKLEGKLRQGEGAAADLAVPHGPAPRSEAEDAFQARLSGLETDLGAVIAERDFALLEGQRLTDRVEALRRRLASFNGIEARIDGLIAERDLAQSKGERLSQRVRHLEGRLAELKTSQRQLIARVQERTEMNLGEIEAMIALTGLSVDDLLKDAERDQGSGLGGPFVGLGDDAGLSTEFDGLGSNFESSVLRLEQHLDRWAGLQNVLQRLPVSSPLDSYYVASSYGKRRDPFTKKWAMHNGVDLAGSYRAAVWSTAPGEVTFAGRKGPYGKLVEIDHGYGLITRYGHLKEILVKRGEAVGFRHKIGVMGSTGRSTGSHVHYEILFDGTPQDPGKFMKAGKYVFKE